MINPDQFLTSSNERVLTDEGLQGMHGKLGVALLPKPIRGPSLLLFSRIARL